MTSAYLIYVTICTSICNKSKAVSDESTPAETRGTILLDIYRVSSLILMSNVYIVSFRSGWKVISYLLRAQLYPLERTEGSFKYNKSRCQICLNVNEIDIFTSTVTRKTYKINHRFNCSVKWLIYLLACKKCLIQYVGKTVVQFRYRWNNCKYNSRNYNCNQSCMPRHLYKHFSSFGHCEFLQHLSVMVIDRTDPSDPLKREDYWRRTLCALDP